MLKKSLFAFAALMGLVLGFMPWQPIGVALADSQDFVGIESYVDTFIISAYYSPIEGQERYVTGSLAGDKRLNGNGTNGADGTPVYPGMIAAPSKYPFGTKMNIPGIGTVAVHDRGGAIVVAGERGHAHDRLDVWMGYGDAGLTRALQWGKREVQVIVYGVNESIVEDAYIEGYVAGEQYVSAASNMTFARDIYFGDDGEQVREMQQQLVDWGYLDEVSGYYGADTAQAVFEFQLDHGVVVSADELGAGHFGVNTRQTVETILNEGHDADALKLQKGRALLQKYPDLREDQISYTDSLSLGDGGEAVTLLQEELVRLGYLRIEPNGYFGETTEHAVFKFQQARGIVQTKDDRGAGYVGPATRNALNGVASERYRVKSLIAYQRGDVVLAKLED